MGGGGGERDRNAVFDLKHLNAGILAVALKTQLHIFTEIHHPHPPPPLPYLQSAACGIVPGNVFDNHTLCGEEGVTDNGCQGAVGFQGITERHPEKNTMQNRPSIRYHYAEFTVNKIQKRISVKSRRISLMQYTRSLPPVPYC